MTARPAARAAIFALLAGLVAAAASSTAACRSSEDGRRPTPHASLSLVATLRTEPATFNRYTGTTYPTHVISRLTQAPLVRINSATQQLEPWLADRWTASADGVRYRLHLREGVSFSDGQPFSADDVLFSFAAVYDERVASPLADALRVDGKPLSVRSLGPHEIELTFPAPYRPGLRLLDTLPIYPRHRLQPALDAGRFRAAWGPATPLADFAGLGPFVLERYDPGQRLVFARNPRYWRRDASGRRLPYLDRLTLEIVADQNTELLRLRAGQTDLMQNELRPEDYVPLRADADAGRVRLIDVGLGLDTHVLWFNLASRPRNDRAWLQRDELRRAIDCAVDRRQFVRTVYLGAAEPAWSLVSASNREWFDAGAPQPSYDPAHARALLASLNLLDRNGDGRLEDERGRPARFTLLVQKGVTAGEKGAAVLREALANVGLEVDVAALDLGAMMTRWAEGDYDAIYHFAIATDTDPAGNMDLWLSSGSAHFWHPGQARPATAWEAQIDRLMRQQSASASPGERRRLFSDVQRIVAEHRPVLVFATPRVYLATSARVANASPAPQRPQLLWSADTLSVAGGAAR